MSWLGNIVSPRKKLLQQEFEIRDLHKELTTLREQNESMRSGMRRCVSCDYRLDYKKRQDKILKCTAPEIDEPDA